MPTNNSLNMSAANKVTLQAPQTIRYNKDGSVAKKRGRKPKSETENNNSNNSINSEINSNTEDSNFTSEEQEAYTKMLEKNSVDTGIDVNNIMSEAESEEKNIPAEPQKNISSRQKKTQNPVCTRCDKEIKSSAYRLNLTYLTSTPSWHRLVANDKPILCKECANELSDLIDKWFIDGGAETKFPIPINKDERNNEKDEGKATKVEAITDEIVLASETEGSGAEDDFDF